MIKRLLVAVPLFIAGGIVVCLIVLMLTGRQTVWHTFFGEADLGPAHFQTLVRSSAPNHYLVCPDGYCTGTIPDAVSRTYPMAREDLLAQFAEIVGERKNTRIIPDAAPDDVRFVERTPFLQFPDTVSIKVIDAGENASQVAIFSRSQIGRSDFGVNQRRVETLLAELQNRVDRQ